MNLKTTPFEFLFKIFTQKLRPFVSTIIFILLISPSTLFAQSKQNVHGFGAILLEKSEYEKLPTPNWDTLLKYSGVKTLALPSSITLNSPPIGDQGTQGSCVGWATGYAALGTLAFPKYSCWSIAKRSPSYVFNQIKINCIDGALLIDGVRLVCDQGSCSILAMPYNQNDCATQPNTVQRYQASKNDAVSYSAISPNTNLTAIKQALSLGYPVVCAFTVYQSFMTCWYDDGIWDLPNSGLLLGNHAVCIVGYDDAVQRLKVQNSWGAYEGDNGFFWIPYSKITNGELAEEYIISGMNLVFQETLTGGTPVCSSGKNFTVNYMESLSGITWYKSSNLNLSSTNGNSATFTANGSGTGYVRVNISSPGCSSHYLADYPVWVGTPVVNVTGPTQGCTNNTYYFTAASDVKANVSNYTWSLVPLNGNTLSPYGSLNSQCAITFYNPYSASGYDVKSKAQNACGLSADGFINIYVRICYSYTLSPNPASENVTITVNATGEINELSNEAALEAMNTIFTIRIVDLNGGLRYIGTKSGGSFNIPVNNLKDGIYIVQITEGDNTTSLRLVVKH